MRGKEINLHNYCYISWMLIDGQYWNFVTDVIAECKRHGDRMTEFVHFAQLKLTSFFV